LVGVVLDPTVNRDILQVLVLSLLVQLASFAKAILITYYFGVGALLDGYYLAQAIPAMCAGVLVGFFQTGFAPLYSAHLARKEDDKAASLLGGALTLAASIGLGVSIAISVLAPTLVSALVGAQGTAITAPAVTALRALAFLLLLNAVVDCVGLALNAHHRYVATTAAPIVNALSATAILAAAPDWGLTNLIAGTLAGLLLQLIVVLGAAHRAGIRLAGARYDQVAETIRTGAAILPGVAFSNLALLLPSTFAARIGEGAVSAFSIASRLHGALTQVLAIALSTVLLPHFAHAIASDESRRVVDWLRIAFPTICALGIVLVLWVGLAGPGAVALIFERGSFDAAATTSVASVWLWLTVGLFPSVWGIALAKVLQAMQLGGLLSWIAALSIASLFGFSYIGVALDSLNVVAYAVALAASASAVAFASIAGSRLTHAGAPPTAVPTGLPVFVAATAIAMAISNTPSYFKTPLSAAVATLFLVVIVVLVGVKHLARQRRCRNG
jgi:putative peptidoglycan lipid II flippase